MKAERYDDEDVTTPMTGGSTVVSYVSYTETGSETVSGPAVSSTTVPANQHPAQEEDSGETVTIANKSQTATRPVVGWLVCVEGADFGKSFPLHIGWNRIGRGTDNDIILTDEHVSRENMASILYEPFTRQFTVKVGDSANPVYVNRKPLVSDMNLAIYDFIMMGYEWETLLFVPLCGEKFSWPEAIWKAPEKDPSMNAPSEPAAAKWYSRT